MPEISVVIPTHNRCERLRACLDALAAQTAEPERFEVVVCVDGSRDGTEEMLRSLETPFALRVVVQPQSGQARARNAAVAAASAPLVLLLDDDMVAAPELVAAHLAAHAAAPGPVAALGRIGRSLPEGIDRFALFRGRQWSDHYERLRSRAPGPRDCYSGNLSLPRGAFEAVGGFSTDLYDELDIDLALRLARKSLGFVSAPDALATEHQREDWREIGRDARRRGAETVELYRRYPEILPTSRLGGHESLGRAGALARRLLLGLRVPPVALAALGRTLPEDAGDRLFDAAYGAAFWRGVRDAADDDLRRGLGGGCLVLNYHALGGAGEAGGRCVRPRRGG